jgi:hypothetical protein
VADTRLRRILIALVLFGAAFGYIEAAAAIYLRVLYEPIHQRAFPGCPPGDLFPLLTLERLAAEGPSGMLCLWIELGREAATLVLLAALGLALGRSFRHGFAIFLIGFGLWDLFYYVFLKALIGWPDSLLAWDLLFLLPVPWAGPVLAPVLVAVGMVGAGTLVLWREARGRPVRMAWSHWAGLTAAGLVIVAAFCWDFRNQLDGGPPNPFPWPLFGLGAALGALTFGHALWGGAGVKLKRPAERREVLEA